MIDALYFNPPGPIFIRLRSCYFCFALTIIAPCIPIFNLHSYHLDFKPLRHLQRTPKIMALIFITAFKISNELSFVAIVTMNRAFGINFTRNGRKMANHLLHPLGARCSASKRLYCLYSRRFQRDTNDLASLSNW